MALQASQSLTTTPTAPTTLTPSASETIAQASAGGAGVLIRVTTTGTATTVAVLDPNSTIQGNPGTVTGVAMPATGSRQWLIPAAAFTGGTATVTFSGALTGVTYELWRV